MLVIAPLLVEYVPAPQAAQEEPLTKSVVVENVPAAQSWQTEKPVPGLYVP